MTKDKAQKILVVLKAAHPGAECELNFKTPFQLLVAVILSAQCTDARVNIVTEKLFSLYDTPTAFANLQSAELEKLIFSTGFYKNKAQNLIAMSKKLLSDFGGDVPKTMEELTSLAGVGRKTASVVLMVAFGVPAMPVDTHVNRVSKRIGLANGCTVERVEEELCRLFAPADWNDVHHTLIFHGRRVCHSQRPNCTLCTLKAYCKYYTDGGKDKCTK